MNNVSYAPSASAGAAPIPAAQHQQTQGGQVVSTAQQQQLFSVIDMKEMLRMSLALMSPENAQRHKSQVKAKYGFDDTTI